MSYQFAVKVAGGEFYPECERGSFSLSSESNKYYFRALGFNAENTCSGMWGEIDATTLLASCREALAPVEPDPGMAGISVPPPEGCGAGGIEFVKSEMPRGRVQEIAAAFVRLIAHATDGMVYWNI